MQSVGLKSRVLSYNHAMEKQLTKTDFTNVDWADGAGKRLLLTQEDAEEYYAYKKQKKIAEIMDALSKSEGVIEETDDAQRAVECAQRIRQAVLRVTPTYFARSRGYFTRGKVGADCQIGGDGEVLPKVKAYEMKLARRMGAVELTGILTPSLVDGCRYSELRKEMKLMKRAVGKRVLKFCVDKQYPYTTLMRLARLASETGANYFSVPHFAGCEQLRYELYRGCRLEVVGVETLAEFKKMMGAGVGRIVTACGQAFYTQWMQETEKIRYIPPKTETVERTVDLPVEAPVGVENAGINVQS